MLKTEFSRKRKLHKRRASNESLDKLEEVIQKVLRGETWPMTTQERNEELKRLKALGLYYEHN